MRPVSMAYGFRQEFKQTYGYIDLSRIWHKIMGIA